VLDVAQLLALDGAAAQGACPLPLTTPARLPARRTLQALGLSGSLLGDFPIRVSPSKTAIVPVNNTYLPKSTEERELVARTVFVGNIDRVVEREQLREFFANLCGEWRGGCWGGALHWRSQPAALRSAGAAQCWPLACVVGAESAAPPPAASPALPQASSPAFACWETCSTTAKSHSWSLPPQRAPGGR
jgi:hypothetical protein